MLRLAAAGAVAFLPVAAYAACVTPGPDSDCDSDGCTPAQGDCNDSLDGGVRARGQGCPNGAFLEICDGVDNDCTMGVDRNAAGVVPDAGAVCSTGLQGVCGPGTTACTSGAIVCTQNVMSSGEVCDGLDNNCNGTPDEGLTRMCYGGPAGSFTGVCPPPAGMVGTCSPRPICAGVMQTCSGGTFGTCDMTTPGQTFPAASETCNNMDDNCNGQVDEGNPGGGAPCTVPGQQGPCATGQMRCMGGTVQCVQTVFAQPTETCDNVDNNCNGMTDEGVNRVCYDGLGHPGSFTGTCPGTNCVPRGLCRGVMQACSSGAFPACDGTTPGQTFPVAEVCDNMDNDCNGQPDNGNPGGGAMCAVAGQQGPCAVGVRTCQSGNLNCPQSVFSSGEICDGIDNNCNGVPDDNVTRVCYAGPAGTFTGVCPPTGNNIGTCTPRGPCMGVTQTCTGAAFPACNMTTPGQVGPSPEICDNIDNDCDGTLNDNVADAGEPCVASGMGRCASGTTTCNAGGNLVCTGLAAIPEQCNGIDDNCNGLVDDQAGGAAGSLVRTCYAGPGGTFTGVCPPPGNTQVGTCAPRGPCAGVTQTCPGAAGFATCNAAVAGQLLPQTEICDGVDNDCNGTPDNGDPGGGGMCAAAAMGVCAMGTTHCMGGAPVCSPGPAQTEQCNTVDENCNGVPNDVPPRKCFSGPNVTPVTYTGACPGPMCNPKGVCTPGQQLCDVTGNFGGCALADGGVITTPANPPDQDEAVCNGLDDDCDGTVDDGNFDRDGDGVKVCNNDCNDDPDGGALQSPLLLEICDGIDNNCDTFIDGVNTPCYTGPAGTVMADGGVGQCRAGMGPCMNGMPPPANMCVGQVLPGTEGNVCDRIDNDCDGKVDEDFDLDGDGVPSCILCPLITPCDCNDDPDGGTFQSPSAREICDCQDNNCNGTPDEGGVCAGAPCHDFDFDHVTNCQGDCNDTNALIGPNRSEQRGNGLDDDCDGQIDEDTDEDGDMYSVGQGDCDDKFANVNPAAPERCDGFDNNCDGRIDEGFDTDNDSATTCAGDCRDNDPNVSPFKKEICGNGTDDDCDGLIDEDLDEDGDGVTTCNNDCNDHNALVHPAYMSVAVAPEICDGQDNDCNGQFDEGFDVDMDGVAVCFNDCDDNDPTRSPFLPEVPTPMAGTPKDENCNGQIDEGSADNDHDGFTGFCGDCNDADPTISPHGREVCDRVDNNCDSLVDALPGNSNLCSACFDNDHDGQTNCDGDCDDADVAVYRGAAEVCDGKLNSCGASVGVDLDENGFRVCRDAGMEVDGGEDGGSDAGTGGGSGGAGGGDPMATGGGGERPIVIPGCGCGSGESAASAGMMFALLVLLSRRQKVRVPVKLVRAAKRGAPLLGVALVTLLVGCQSSLTHPERPVPDSGSEVVDAGTDGGFMPPVDNWDCPGLYPAEQIPVQVPMTDNPFAIAPRFQRTEVAAARALLFDDGVADVAAFVLSRDIPLDVDQTLPAAALDTIAVREIAALDGLQGTPLVRERTERTSRQFVGPTYSTSQNLVFATATNAFAVRNRLLAGFSGLSLATLGSLPQVAGAAADDHMVVNVMFRLSGGHLFISVAVTTLAKLKQNQPVILDLTNGSALGAPNAKLQYRCEHRTAPALKSDFIFIVDNSGSMSEEQAALVNAAGSLYSAFQSSGLDFRLGVITTDSDVLRGVGFTRDLAQFQSDVKVGINGNGTEMGLEFGLRAIRSARLMSLPPEKKLRDDAGLVLVILSDEENTGLKTVQQYAADFVVEKAVIFSIVGPKPIGCARVGLGRANAGAQYIDAAVATGGSSGSICNPNLLEIVEEVVVGSLGAASKSSLLDRPISNSLAVRTTVPVARSRTNGFDYDPGGNTVLFFGAVPAEGSMFDAAYSYFAVID